MSQTFHAFNTYLELLSIDPDFSINLFQPRHQAALCMCTVPVAELFIWLKGKKSYGRHAKD